MASRKNGGKGFCPFCGSEFAGEYDNCPFCGQDIRRYTDDLGPIMGTIQNATNIDMKSPKAQIAVGIIVILLISAAGLVIFDYYEKNIADPGGDVPSPEGIMVEVRNDGFIDLTGDFADRDLSVVPLYEPQLKLLIKLNDKHISKYQRITWIVQTDGYCKDNLKNPFYQKVTKEGSETNIHSVLWENVEVGRFWITAECYTKDDRCDIYSGQGTYYGRMDTSYIWMYNERTVSFDYTMPMEDVVRCLGYDLEDRLVQQSKGERRDFVTDSTSVADMTDKLKSLYNKSYRYSDAGFADFVLSFVQSNFPEVYDSFNYRTSDYWAYPDETVLWGCGDDEDRAILYCALMRAADIDVGLLELPGSTIAAVNVDLSESFIGTYAKTVKGKDGMLTVADTTSELRLGMIRDCYDVSRDGLMFYYNGDPIPSSEVLVEI